MRINEGCSAQEVFLMKIKEFQEFLKKKRIGVALFTNYHLQEFNHNMFYFSQYDGLGALIIPQKGKPELIVPEMEYLRAKKESIVAVRKSKEKSLMFLADKLRKYKRIGVDYTYLTVYIAQKLKKMLQGKSFVDVSEFCLGLRAVKTDKEIAIIRQGVEIADEIMQSCFFNFKNFKTESDVASFLIGETAKRGLSVSFKPIVASGSNGAEPHHNFDSNKLRKGFCIIDFGIRYKGYCTDMTRTVYIGKPSKKDVELYHNLLHVQQLLLGVQTHERCVDVYDMAHRELGKYSKYFNHGLGHGVGLQIHEKPSLSMKGDGILQHNMIFTIEPGIYFAGKGGIRIEDMVLVTEKKTEVLTKTGKNLLIVNK